MHNYIFSPQKVQTFLHSYTKIKEKKKIVTPQSGV